MRDARSIAAQRDEECRALDRARFLYRAAAGSDVLARAESVVRHRTGGAIRDRRRRPLFSRCAVRRARAAGHAGSGVSLAAS